MKSRSFNLNTILARRRGDEIRPNQAQSSSKSRSPTQIPNIQNQTYPSPQPFHSIKTNPVPNNRNHIHTYIHTFNHDQHHQHHHLLPSSPQPYCSTASLILPRLLDPRLSKRPFFSQLSIHPRLHPKRPLFTLERARRFRHLAGFGGYVLSSLHLFTLDYRPALTLRIGLPFDVARAPRLAVRGCFSLFGTFGRCCCLRY